MLIWNVIVYTFALYLGFLLNALDVNFLLSSCVILSEYGIVMARVSTLFPIFYLLGFKLFIIGYELYYSDSR